MTEIGKIHLDDTPVDGQKQKGVTSNWAYDHENNPDGHGNSLYPWTIFVPASHTPKSQVNWNTIVLHAAQINNFYLIASNTINSEIAWDLVLSAGTWTVELLIYTDAADGIYSIRFDGVEKGTVDGYSSPAAANILKSVAGIVVPITKKIELRLKIASKNPLSGDYYAHLTGVMLKRTA
jgi:hypothetical protein